MLDATSPFVTGRVAQPAAQTRSLSWADDKKCCLAGTKWGRRLAYAGATSVAASAVLLSRRDALNESLTALVESESTHLFFSSLFPARRTSSCVVGAQSRSTAKVQQNRSIFVPTAFSSGGDFVSSSAKRRSVFSCCRQGCGACSFPSGQLSLAGRIRCSRGASRCGVTPQQLRVPLKSRAGSHRRRTTHITSAPPARRRARLQARRGADRNRARHRGDRRCCHR